MNPADDVAGARARARGFPLDGPVPMDATDRQALLVGLAVIFVLCLIAFAIGRWSKRAPAPAPRG